jgi:hypothetical protein
MVFVSNKNPSIQTWLAIQFSETDQRLGAFSSSAPAVFAVEGCCLYGMTFHSSTLIEKIFHQPPRRRQFTDLLGLFGTIFFDPIRTKNPHRQRGEGYHRVFPWQAAPFDPRPTP